VNELVARLETLVGATPVEWTPRGGGYSTADRFSVTLDDGRTVFVKSAHAEHMAGWLRREHEVYAHLSGSFIPNLIAFDDDGARPMLVLEDLSGADWAPNWMPARVDAVLGALDELHASPPPPNTTSVRESHGQLFDRWQAVAADPEPFLSTGLRSRAWLDDRLATLVEAARSAPVDGDAVLHLDVRSDNICTVGRRAILVDWNWTALGNPDVDVVAWLPSLALEGGPKPWEVVRDASALAAWVAGFWAALVGLPPPETAPTVREGQKRQLSVTLDWLDREL